MRVLIASTGGVGHFTPLVPFVEALRGRGDEVLVAVPPGLAATVAGLDVPYLIGADPPADERDQIWDRVPHVSPREAAVLVNREIFGRLNTAAMLPSIDRACRDWRPDLVLREPCEFACAVAADRHRIAQVQVAISQAEVEWSSLTLAAPALEPYADGLVERLRASAYLTRFPASLDPSPFPLTRRFRESGEPPRRPLPDWWEGHGGPLVYVTFGSIAGGLPVGTAAYRVALESVSELPVRVLLTLGYSADVAALDPVPANVHLAEWVPQADVLAEASAVVCHGGSGTTFGALAAGVPLVMVPLFADQPDNARQVAMAGAGLVVDTDLGAGDRMRSVGPAHVQPLRRAIEAVLVDESYRSAARAIADEMRDQPAVGQLLDEFEPA